MTTAIRHFAIADYAAAYCLWERTEGVGLSEADSEQGIAQFLTRNPGLSFVASTGERIVGTILCGHDGRRGLIHHLAVHRDFRRSGLGRLLVRSGLAALKSQGIDKCHLLVFQDNSQARAFWLRVGSEERTSLAIYSLPTHAAG